MPLWLDFLLTVCAFVGLGQGILRHSAMAVQKERDRLKKVAKETTKKKITMTDDDLAALGVMFEEGTHPEDYK